VRYAQVVERDREVGELGGVGRYDAAVHEEVTVPFPAEADQSAEHRRADRAEVVEPVGLARAQQLLVAELTDHLVRELPVGTPVRREEITSH
jgi:hypothetical protein